MVAYRSPDAQLPGAQHDHTVRSLASHNLLPRPCHNVGFGIINIHSEDRRRGIADGQSGAIIWDPIKVGDLHARCCAIVGEDHVIIEIHLTKVRKFAVVRLELSCAIQFELLHDVT